MNLFEITKEIEFALYNCCDEDGIIIDDKLADSLEALEGKRDDKVLKCAKYIKELKYKIDMFEDEIKTLQTKKGILENKVKSFERYVLNNWSGSELEDSQASIKKVANTTTILDSDAIPDKYKQVVEKKEIKIDKKAIKEDIRNGIAVPGAEIEIKLKVG